MTQPPLVDTDAGMECYATSTPPCEAKLRSHDEDFQVEEVMKDARVSLQPFPGSYPLYKVEKRSIDTFHLERELAAVLNSRVKYVGIKDKRAIATQFMSPLGRRSNVPAKIEGAGYRCELVGYLPQPIAGSMIVGNRFKIVLRGCCPTMSDSVAECFKSCEENRMPNFFGLQRFGIRDVRTSRIGKALVACEFEDGVKIMLIEPRVTDDETTALARRLMGDQRFEEALEYLPSGQDMERIVARCLARKPGDFVGAMRGVPLALRRLYVQAYQAYIFNSTLSLALRKGLDISVLEKGDNWGETSSHGMSLKKVHGVKEPFEGKGAVPLIQLVGYAYRNYNSRFDLCTEEVLHSEGVRPGQFYVKEMQEVSAEGGFRRTHMTVREASFGSEKDTATLRFMLARGEYATVLLREIIKPDDPASSGFG